MTYLIKLEDGQPTGYPVLEQNFRQLFPDTSLPKLLTAGVVEPLGYGIYEYRGQPELGRYEKAVQTTPTRSDSGIWGQTWDIVEMDETEKAGVDADEAKKARLNRNALLQETDWVVIFHTEKGTNIPLEWEAYRQALRDITDHVNFPYLEDADWPVKP